MPQIEMEFEESENASNKINEIELRDLFAMHIIGSIISEKSWSGPYNFDCIAEKAYEVADAMLDARSKR